MKAIWVISGILILLTACNGTITAEKTEEAGPYSCIYNDTYSTASWTEYEEFFPEPKEFGECWAITPDPVPMDTAVQTTQRLYGGFYFIDVNKSEVIGSNNSLYIQGPLEKRKYIKFYMYEFNNPEYAKKMHDELKELYAHGEPEDENFILKPVEVPQENCFAAQSTRNTNTICMKDNYLFLVSLAQPKDLSTIKSAIAKKEDIPKEEYEKLKEAATNLEVQEQDMLFFLERLFLRIK
ncbi:hypothetical protein GF343_04590 [Candidatus Woesearchaeota archaeon]|nr:hypothetical protein [Candidatus Woesearchaeota archaeon]